MYLSSISQCTYLFFILLPFPSETPRNLFRLLRVRIPFYLPPFEILNVLIYFLSLYVELISFNFDFFPILKNAVHLYIVFRKPGSCLVYYKKFTFLTIIYKTDVCKRALIALRYF